jgi:hypothetical protein
MIRLLGERHGEQAQNLSIAVDGSPLKDIGGIHHVVVTGWPISPLGIDTYAISRVLIVEHRDIDNPSGFVLSNLSEISQHVQRRNEERTP